MSTSAPARIDLAGGTLDIPPLCFFFKDTLTINLAVDLRVTVALSPGGSGSVSGPGLEPLPIEDLALFRHTFDYFSLAPHWDVSVDNQIPRASGLGGSSSLLVALVGALKAESEQAAGTEELINSVTVLENRLLGKPAGTQDGLAAVFGGLSEIGFERGTPERNGMRLPDYLSGPLHLAYSPVRHHSGINNWALVKAACEGDAEVLDVFSRLNQNAHSMRAALKHGGPGDFLACLRGETDLRDELWPGLKNDDMLNFSRALPTEYVAKVCGAGGGGCMFVYTPDPDPKLLDRLAKLHNLDLIQVNPDHQGSVTT